MMRHLKVNSLSKGFRYKISPKLLSRDLIGFINDAKSKKVKYILISVSWDQKMKFEVKKDRLRGGPFFKLGHENSFNHLLNYVKELDEFATKTNKIKFVLASKKAVDWEKFLKSDYLDLRNFEELGFTLSQCIYAIQEIVSCTINWPSTFSVWITNCSGIMHL